MKRIVLSACLLFALNQAFVSASDLTLPPSILRKEAETGEVEARKLILPYVFATESLGVAGGAAAGASAWPNKQSSLFGAVMGTTNESWALYLVGTSMKIPWGERWFVDTNASVGWFTEQRVYADGNPAFPEGDAGSNDSDPENFIQGEGWNNWLRINFKYVLPIGYTRDESVSTYVLDRGLLVSGSTLTGAWNPLRSGRTLLQLEPFLFHRTFGLEDGDQDGSSGGLSLSMLYDNRDFSPNPSRGSATSLEIASAAGLDEDSGSWTNLRGKFSKYLSLGESRWTRQQVLAFNVWTAYTPSWGDVEETHLDHAERPPPSMGASLGGYLRMRGYPLYRFQDEAAIYYGAEYRVIPRWNPLGEISWLRWLQLDWWQFVPFLEAGRVANGWDLGDLHADMKWDAGIGVRLMAALAVVRADMAFSEEGFHFWAMVGQAF